MLKEDAIMTLKQALKIVTKAAQGEVGNSSDMFLALSLVLKSLLEECPNEECPDKD